MGTGGNDATVEEALLELVVREFRALGYEPQVQGSGDGAAIHLTRVGDAAHIRFNLANTFDMARRCPPEAWPALAADRVRAFLDMTFLQLPRELTAEQLRAQIRTRLFPPSQAGFDYARTIAEGLTLVLAVDYPSTVLAVADPLLEGIPLPLDELYTLGQANTDQEPIEQRIEVSEHTSVLTGGSLFLASRAANWATLVPDVVGPAPLGVVFGVPDRENIIYAVLTHEDWLDQVLEVAGLVHNFTTDPRHGHPGGVLSGDTYYASPEGLIHRLAHFTDDGSLAMTPTKEFERRFVE
ncbi:MAG: hypothetical protein Q4D79_08775 [Propionibacteriaceae bacterium]|nr:hypothetical protein [Propionibacteriaceae bacterium]